jgi:hypothetical protein
LVSKTRINFTEVAFEFHLEPLLHQGTWQFIYRLLPCFVASYVDLTNDDRVTAEAKNFYHQFISILVDSYSLKPDVSRGMIEVDPSISFLKWKFASVTSELKVQLYGDTEPATITRQLQEKCFDVLTDFLGRVEKTSGSLYQRWRILLYDFSERMQKSLLQLTGLPVGFSGRIVGIEDFALSTLCRMLAAHIFKNRGFKDKLELTDSRLLLDATFAAYVKSEKLKITKLHNNGSKCKNWSDAQSMVKAEGEQLSEQQRLGLVLYLCISSSNVTSCVSRNFNVKIFQLTYNASDALEQLNYQILRGHFSRAAEKIPVFMSQQLSQVSLQFAKDMAPTCYSPVLDRVVNGKVKMDAPGQNTFCPVPHCRWCGLVKNPSEMLVCQFCTDKPKYPDTHLFCSPECEDFAMKDQHGERHAEFLEYGLGLKKVNPNLNVPFVSPNCIMFK